MKLQVLIAAVVAVAAASSYEYDMQHITDDMREFIATTSELKGLVELAEKVPPRAMIM